MTKDNSLAGLCFPERLHKMT